MNNLGLSFSTDVCRNTLVCHDGIGGVFGETGVSQVCREKPVCRDKEEKKT